jgi:Fe-S cluster biosynthesis and repair protein YggX
MSRCGGRAGTMTKKQAENTDFERIPGDAVSDVFKIIAKKFQAASELVIEKKQMNHRSKLKNNSENHF